MPPKKQEEHQHGPILGRLSTNLRVFLIIFIIKSWVTYPNDGSSFLVIFIFICRCI